MKKKSRDLEKTYPVAEFAANCAVWPMRWKTVNALPSAFPEKEYRFRLQQFLMWSTNAKGKMKKLSFR